jgi:O-antigen/teichoic acid export membrane protein
MATTEISTGRRMIVGGAARFLGVAIRMVVGFFMLPFLVGTLGDYWYGVYYATVALVANLYLMDFGFANATMRETAIGLATSDDDAVNRTINTALRIYLGLGLVVAASIGILTLLAPVVLGTATNVGTIRIVLLIVGLDLALTFPSKALAGIVMGKLRYDLLLVLDMLTFGLSTVATVWLLMHGFGVIAMALVALGTGQLHNVLYIMLARHLFPAMVVQWKRFDRKTGRALASYSVWALLIQLANQLRFRVDSLTTGALFGGEAITRYSIGARLVEYAQSPLVLVSNTAMPALARLHATEEHGRLSEVVLFLLRVHLLIAIYAAGLVVVLGRPFIVRWLGPEHGSSHEIATVLAIGFMTELFLMPLTNSLFASAKHRSLAIANLTEAIVNIAMSIVLGRLYGLLGIALGTSIPLLAVQLFWVAPYGCRSLGISVGRFARLALPAVVAIVVFVLVSSALTGVAASNGYVGLVLAAAGITLVYWPAVIALCLTSDDRGRIWSALPFGAADSVSV